MGAPLLIVFGLKSVFVIGGLLIRGQGYVRGPRFWLGLALMFTVIIGLVSTIRL